MADVTPIIPAGRQVIETYGDGRFRVSGEVHDGSVIIVPTRTIPWPVAAMDQLTYDSFAALLPPDMRPDVLLLGCGPRMQLVPSGLRKALREAGIVVEPMDTGAACRTYNVLLAEERRVAAALIAVD